MHLIRVLIFFTCKYDFWFTVSHVPGRLNEATDTIFRNIYVYVLFTGSRGRSLNIFPLHSLLVMLLSQNITWTLENWIMLFRHFAADLTPTIYYP